MTKEQKEQFMYWLTNNMYINAKTSELIVKHVDHYFSISTEQTLQIAGEAWDAALDWEDGQLHACNGNLEPEKTIPNKQTYLSNLKKKLNDKAQ